MNRKLFLSLCLLLSAATVAAQETGADAGATAGAKPGAAAAANPGSNPAATGAGDPDAKMVRGMSVLGNNEAPMSLFIVPWKSSELGAVTSLSRTLDEHDVPVDRDVFMRELDFYQVSVGTKTPVPAAVAASK